MRLRRSALPMADQRASDHAWPPPPTTGTITTMVTDSRRGERLGWLLGWMGTFLFLPVLAVVVWLQGQHWIAVASVPLWALAELLVFRLAPWRYPSTRYWRLMLPLYVVLLASVVLVMVGFGGLEGSGLRWWNMLWVLPMLTPLFILGGRRWGG